MSDLTGTLPKNGEVKDDARTPQVQVNSLDYLVSVDRLPIFRSFCKGIYLYGMDNNYPRKIIQSADRSSMLVTVRNKQSQFIAGQGFPGATSQDVKEGTAVVVNSKGQTAYNLLQFCAEQKSNINIAIHVNYNVLGEAVEFNFIQYDFVRRKMQRKGDKYDRYIITNIWHLENDHSNYNNYSKIQNFNKWVESEKKNQDFPAVECFAYDPDPLIVREQIELSGGIENYSGQLFYMKRTEDVYQKATYDSVADKYQFLAESDLASLSNIQNGYSASGVFKYPGNMDDSKEIADLKAKLNNTKGAQNTGRILTVKMPANADNAIPSNLFESTELQNIDKLYETQSNRAEDGIQQLYTIPNSLIGKDTEGNFATQKMEEAFDFYNAVTESFRQELEIELTTLFRNSIFADQVTLPIEIEPLRFVSTTKVEIVETTKTIPGDE